MISVKWDMEKAKRIWMEEGFEEGFEKGYKEGYKKGFEEGYKEGREKVAINVTIVLLKLKLDLATIAQVTELPIERIKEIGRFNKLL